MWPYLDTDALPLGPTSLRYPYAALSMSTQVTVRPRDISDTRLPPSELQPLLKLSRMEAYLHGKTGKEKTYSKNYLKLHLKNMLLQGQSPNKLAIC